MPLLTNRNLAAKVFETTLKIMKNAILSIAFLLLGLTTFAQSASDHATAQSLTDELVTKYNLNEKQQAEMLVVQQRKFRNLGEIEGLKKTDPVLHIEKIKALTLANDYEMEKILSKDQFATYRLNQVEYRKQKAKVFQEMKDKGATQTQIDYKISLIEEEALMKS